MPTISIAGKIGLPFHAFEAKLKAGVRRRLPAAALHAHGALTFICWLSWSRWRRAGSGGKSVQAA